MFRSDMPRPWGVRCRHVLVFVILVSSALLVAACAAGGSPAAPSRGGAPPAAADATPLDAAALVRAARLAFRPEGDGWRGGGDAYAVRADARGFEVEPLAAARPGAAPLRVAAPRVARGDRLLSDGQAEAQGATRVRVEPDGHFIVDRGELAQHLRNTPEGVELSFSFPRRPEGAGDLTVRLPVEGQAYAGETAGGHHFADARGVAGLRVGRATWIDARGASADVPVRAVDGGLELRVPAHLLDEAAYPALLDPLISPEIEPDAPVLSVASDFQVRPAIACDGDLCLVAWVDTRLPVRLYATRVSTSGAVLDPSGIFLADLPGLSPSASGSSVQTPQVAASGGMFFVVSAAPGPAPQQGGAQPTHLRGVRVTSDGTVLDPGGLSISAPLGGRFESHAVVTHAAGSFLVFWERVEPGMGMDSMLRARVTPGGAVLDPDGVPVAQGSVPQAIASHGTGAYLLWYDGALRGSAVDAQGALLDPTGLVLFQPQPEDYLWKVNGAVTFDGAHHVVAWAAGLERHAWAARFTPAGAPVDPSPIQITDSWIDQVIGAAFDGTTTFVLGIEQGCGDDYCDDPDLRLARLDASGAPLDPTAPLLSPYTSRASIAAGSGVLAAWESLSGPQTCSTRLVGARLLSQGAPVEGSPFPLHWSINEQRYPSVAFNGQSHLVVWTDDRELSPNGPKGGLYGVRVSPAGEVLDPAAIAIKTEKTTDARAIFDGTSTVVFSPAQCSCDSGCLALEAVRVGAGGEILDPTPIPLPFFPDTPLTAAVGGGTLLLEMVSAQGDVLDPPLLWKLEPSGALVGPTPITGGDLPLPEFFVSQIVSDGEGYLLLLDGVDQPSLLGARMSADGVLLPPGVFPILSLDPNMVRAAFVGTSYVVLARQYHGAFPGFDVRAARVTPAGDLLDPPEGLLVASYDSGHLEIYGLAVAPTAEGALLSWLAPPANGDAGASVLQGAVLDGAGVVGPPFTITEGLEAPTTFALAGDPQGGALVAYPRQVEYPATRAQRVRLRVIGDCGPATCPDGYCVDGVCCDSPCGGGDPLDCEACSVAAGAPADGTCAPLDAAACDDGDACTPQDTCVAGLCTGGPIAEPCAPADPPAPPDACDAPGACGPAAEPEDDTRFGGCGCRIADAPRPGGPALITAAALALALALLRRRRPDRAA